MLTFRPTALRLYFLLTGCFFTQWLCAQDTALVISGADERLFIESKWRYTYTLHSESNTIIHKADKDYQFFLYFRYDYTYQEFLNGKLEQGNWSLNERTLFYSFQHVNKFEIAQLNKSILVLEFTQKNSNGVYQYHFVRVDDREAPFVKPANELPLVLVEGENTDGSPGKPETKKSKWNAWFGKKKAKEPADPPAPAPIYISVELIGGGYYGGIDPVMKDFIRINSNGRLIKEFQSVNNGLLVTKKNIPHDELEMFAEFALKKGFFDFERVYDCKDSACMKRKGMKPTPVPLRIAVAYGQRKKVVTIPIWGEDDRGIRYVEYPPELDLLIDGIQRMANRLEGNL